MRYPKTRLSLLMFIQYFIWGATGPVLSLYLHDCLGFSGAQVGLILGLSALGSIFSPAFMSFVADRVVSSERLLCYLNVVGGVCMFVFSRQTEWYPTLAVYVVYQIAVSPMSPLINAITFHHSPVERHKFGNIRVWGTIGWIAVAWFFSFGLLHGGSAVGGGSKLPILLDVSAITSFIMAAYCLTIPKRGRIAAQAVSTISVSTEPVSTEPVSIAETTSGSTEPVSIYETTSVSTASVSIPETTPVLTTSVSMDESTSVSTEPVSIPESTSVSTTSVSIPESTSVSTDPVPTTSTPRPSTRSALKVILRPQALALSVVTAAITFVDKFYNVGTAPFLRSVGLSERAVMPAMSLGQVPEIVAMGILGYLLARWGAKKVLLFGVAMEMFRFAAFAAGVSVPLIYAGLCVHGLAYTFTMITAVICLDGFCGVRDRSGAHQLFNVATAGIGGFLGSYAAGWTVDIFTDRAAGIVNYRGYWAVPLILSILVFFVLGTVVLRPKSKP